MSIALITMGGTIDKDYFDALSEYQVVESTLLSDVANLGLELNFASQSICKKDSLEVTDDDRQALLDAINELTETHILVSHGTDTLADTARFLKDKTEKTVLLFGAMRPSRFKDTDALFNFAFALGALKQKPPGVYLAMSAEVFDPDEVVKNRDQGRFEIRTN